MAQKVVHYRKFDPKQEPWLKGTCQSLLRKSLESPNGNGGTFLSDFNARRFSVQGADDLVRFSHNILIADESIFGTLCLFLKDEWAVVLRAYEESEQESHISLDQTFRQMEIAERPPIDGEDYLRGIAYWLIVADHLFVVQHTSIQTKAFEDYFYQLFVASSVINSEDIFGFRSEFNKEAVGGDLENITGVEVGGILNTGTVPETLATELIVEVENEEQKTLGRRVSRFEKAKDILKAVFGEPNAEKIIADIPPEAELEVDVRFGYKSRKKDLSRQVLRDIARAARNLPDGEVIAFGKDGRQIGDDLRLNTTMPFQLMRPKGALLDLADARVKLLRVYQRFLEDNKIEL